MPVYRQTDMKRIGITGCIGSGKSTVSSIFARLGTPVYDADQHAKALMVTSPALVSGIRLLFGNEAYAADGTLNRPFISSKAFNDTQLIEGLNALVHPAVMDDFEQWCRQHSGATYVLKEAALMFESNSYKQVDEVIVVTAPEELRIARTMRRDHLTREAVLSRMKNQLTQEEKLARANYEIRNDEAELLIPQVLKLHAKFSA
jgi:dephospho-CoA kinase